MGHVVVSVVLTNPYDATKSAVEEGLVDTGATRSVIPARLAEALGLQRVGHARVRTASGEEELPLSWAFVEIAGKKDVSSLLISDKIDRVLIGVVTLEAMGLAVDPTSGELKEVELLLY
jgi:aspartyl protease family protein